MATIDTTLLKPELVFLDFEAEDRLDLFKKLGQKLAEAGYVARQEHPTDKRQVVVTITAAGEHEVAETRRRRNAWLAGRLADLPAADLAVLTRAAELLEEISAR